MVMQSVSLADELTVTPAQGGVGTAVSDLHFLPTGGKNLAQMAAAAFRQAVGAGGEVDVSIRKHVPVCAGLAGGSADAAAVLHAMNRLTGAGLSPVELAKIGERVGSDVPFCVLGGAALAQGRGELLTPLAPLPDCTLLLAKPDISVSTKYVYEHLDAIPSYRHPDIDGMMASIQAGDLDGVLARMGNVLEAVTIPTWPVIASIKEEMRHLGADGCLMSGSGPTVFGVFGDRALAEAACRHLQQSGLAPWVCLTRPV